MDMNTSTAIIMIKLCELYSREGLSALRSWMALPITAKEKNNREKNSDKLLFVSHCPSLSGSPPTKLFLLKSYVLVLVLSLASLLPFTVEPRRGGWVWNEY